MNTNRYEWFMEPRKVVVFDHFKPIEFNRFK